MMPITALLQQMPAQIWLFLPAAIVLGALHGLEPGHSKTMMAAFIIATRGTVAQAIVLGLAATLSHAVLVWAVALLGPQLSIEAGGRLFQLASAVAIMGLAAWMLLRGWRHGRAHPPARAAAQEEETCTPEERARVNAIRRRLARVRLDASQMVALSLRQGLIPCPAALVVMLLCLQVPRTALSVSLAFCFSVGLAITMISAGVAAARGVQHTERRWSEFDALARRAAYAAGMVAILIALYVGWEGWLSLSPLR
jgi:ABC-type nickel/cobalt efflux system permease component RcnA